MPITIFFGFGEKFALAVENPATRREDEHSTHEAICAALWVIIRGHKMLRLAEEQLGSAVNKKNLLDSF